MRILALFILAGSAIPAQAAGMAHLPVTGDSNVVTVDFPHCYWRDGYRVCAREDSSGDVFVIDRYQRRRDHRHWNADRYGTGSRDGQRYGGRSGRYGNGGRY